MEVSVNVAYRVYRLQQGSHAIAFNTKRRKFMFLEGLSAELLQLVLKGGQDTTTQWLARNDLSERDLAQFMDCLRNFGFFTCDNEDILSQAEPQQAVAGDVEDENKYELNRFQNLLRKNGLYYCFHIDLTNRCNEQCIHCYHPFDQYDYSKELTTAEIKTLIDMLYDLGVFSVTLSGGECLLRPDFFDILSYISSKNMMSVIFTNGVLLTEDVVKKISQHRVKLVSISLYGDTSELHDRITTKKGSYDKTLSGIALLKKHQIPFELKCVVLSENIDRAEDMRRLSQDLNYGQDCKLDFSLCGKVNGDCSVFSHRASSEKIKTVFYSDPERYFGASLIQKRLPDEPPCGAGKWSLYCDAQGDIYPCVSFRHLLCHYTDLPHITENPVLRQWLDVKISDFSDCLKHDYCDYCTEQCAGNNLIENGDFLDSKGVSNCERAKIIAEWFQRRSDDDNHLRKEVTV